MTQVTQIRNWRGALLLFVIGCAGCAPSSVTATQVEVMNGMSQEPAQLTAAVPTEDSPSEVSTNPSPSDSVVPVHNSETRTGIEELDHIIDIFLEGNDESMRDLLVFTFAPCTHELALGGPPKCREGENEGTLVEVFPSLGPEGHFFRKDEVHTWQRPDVAGLYAAYKVSENAYDHEFYPAGKHGLIFMDSNGVASVVLQADQGGIVRIDYTIGSSPDETLYRDAEEIILAPPTSTVSTGYIEILPWQIADAGNWFLYATSILTLTWIDAPSGCEQYEFVLTPSSIERIIIGTDRDPADEISIDWPVPEGLSGAGLSGEALCSGSQVVPSLHSGILYSGDSPPEGVCVIAAGSIGPPGVLREPSHSSETVARLIPGDFAPVLEFRQEGWYRIDTATLTPRQGSESPPDTGWISDQSSLKFFGPCDDIPVAGN